MVRGQKRSNNLRANIIDILSTVESPLLASDISSKVESTTRYSASVSSVQQVMRPLVAKGIIRRSKPTGSPVHTYELI